LYESLKSCGKEFNDFIEGSKYSSVVIGSLLFCSDTCCKKNLNAAVK
jgi:hypothetical protein